MYQRTWLIAALLLLLLGSAGWAQVEEETGALQPPPLGEAVSAEPVAGIEQAPDQGEAGEAPARPATSRGEASGESVVDLAGFVSAFLAESGQVPDLMQVQTGSGSLRTLSAAEAFILMARTVDLWRTTGELPSAVPITPPNVSRPDIDPGDVPADDVDLAIGREVLTESFLGQDAATVRWVDQLHKVPTAVWVEGERLSAAEYMAGLAICLDYAYREGELLDTIFLSAYAPPWAWAAGVVTGVALPTEATEEAESEAGTEAAAQPEGGEAEVTGVADEAEPSEGLLPVMPTEEEQQLAPALQTRPELVVFPEPGATVSGVVELVASYSGPPATFVTFAVDGATRAIMNFPPYGCRWDTSALPPGTHTVRVQVYFEGNVVLFDQVSVYTVVPPKPPAAGEEAEDEL